MRRHNPEKNRAVCVLAKGSVWGLRGLLALTSLSAGLLFIFAVVLKIRRDWDWPEVGRTLLAVAVLLAFAGLLWLVGWLLFKWYEWAKSYARDC